MESSGSRITIYYVFSLCLVLSLCFSCSKESSPEITINTVQDIAKEGRYEEIRGYLTHDTVDAVDKLNKVFPEFSNWENDFAGKFPEGSEWVVIERDIDDNHAKLKLKCIKHPVENIMGFEMIYNMKLENDIWKIDLHEEMKRSIERIEEYKKSVEAGSELSRRTQR